MSCKVSITREIFPYHIEKGLLIDQIILEKNIRVLRIAVEKVHRYFLYWQPHFFHCINCYYDWEKAFNTFTQNQIAEVKKLDKDRKSWKVNSLFFLINYRCSTNIQRRKIAPQKERVILKKAEELGKELSTIVKGIKRNIKNMQYRPSKKYTIQRLSERVENCILIAERCLQEGKKVMLSAQTQISKFRPANSLI